MALSTFSDFESRLGSIFHITVDSGLVPVILKEAKSLGHGRREGGAFSLVFEGPADTDLPQAVYRLQTDDETLDVFLVPIGPFGDGMGFEAVFT